MTPAQHYAEAEGLLQQANAVDADFAAYLLTCAQVHATLANAATAFQLGLADTTIREAQLLLRNPLPLVAIDSAQQVIEKYWAGQS